MNASSAVHESDDQLLEALGRGDPQAIAALYQQNGARMVAFAARYVNDRSAAEDIVVSLLGRWLERPPRIDEAGRLRAFLATSVYHAAIDWIRRERTEQGRPPRSGDDHLAADHRRAGPLLDSDASAAPAVLRRRMTGALERLSASDRLLLETHYGGALTAEECMADLKLSRTAFHQRLHRARLRLARLLAEDHSQT